MECTLIGAVLGQSGATVGDEAAGIKHCELA
jgi:hypothetical protein